MFRDYFFQIIRYFIENRTIVIPNFNYNAIKKFYSYKFTKTPLAIMIEPACLCNLDCPLCTTPHKYITRKKGIMTYETYQKLVNDVKDFALVFYYNFAGEPFLNPNLFEMVNEAAKHNIFTSVDTNATLLTNKRIEEILDSELSVLVVNIDHIEKEKFQSFREGANFERTILGIKKLCDLKKKQRRFFPLIMAEIIVSKQNEDQLQKIYDFAKNKVGVDGAWFKTICFPLHSNGFRQDHEIPELVENYLPKHSTRTRYDYDSGILKLKNPKELCGWEHKSLILWDGRVGACCYDYNGQYTFGNIIEESFLEIWNSKKYRYYREKLIRFKKLELCERCSII